MHSSRIFVFVENQIFKNVDIRDMFLKNRGAFFEKSNDLSEKAHRFSRKSFSSEFKITTVFWNINTDIPENPHTFF